MRALGEVASRLAAGSRGRTEADIQSDVRQFLLDAPLELASDQILDVALEAQAGGGRRIDVEAGCAAIEVKKRLASKKEFEAARDQLEIYVKHRTAERAQRYVGILTDGQTWALFQLTPAEGLTEVSRLRVRGADDAERLATWLESILATNDKVAPTPAEIVRRLGAGSPAAELDLAGLQALYAQCRWDPEVKLKRELWARLLVSALGTNFENSDELFVIHTYLVLTAELVAHEVMGIRVDEPETNVRGLLEGQQFALAGLHGVVEADFFDWPAGATGGDFLIRSIARRLSQFEWSDVDHDVLKALYESIIDKATRKRLGEYYTPDWLAHKIVEEQVTDPLSQRVLDPACGSGTFLFWAIRRVIASCEAAGMNNRETLDHVVSHVFGMDLHPVAVTLARVTYLLAITPARIRLADRGEVAVPVFLGDSVRWEQEDTLSFTDGLTVHTSDELELFEQDLHFPEGVVEDPARFDRLVAALAAKAARRPTQAVPRIGGLLNAHRVQAPQDRAAVELVFTKLCRLHDAGRNHLWGYYIRNLARPMSFSTPAGLVDVLVGNPPWLAFRHMPPGLQRTYRSLAEVRGLWLGGGSATHQDLSDLFAVRSIQLYLRYGGRFAFVMPFATLSRFQYAGFRAGVWGSESESEDTAVEFHSPEAFATVKPPLFAVAACVVSGAKRDRPRPLEPRGVRWSGRLPSHQLDWEQARPHLTRRDADIELASRGIASPYRTRFKQGATLVPRVLVKVVEQTRGPLGGPADLVPVTSARTAVEKTPWKALQSLSCGVERQFLRMTHLGASIVAFRARDPELAVIPWSDGKLLEADDERLDEFAGLEQWWRRAQRLWEQHRSAGSPATLSGRIDYQRGVTAQIPTSPHRVVYSRSGQYLAACRVEDPDVLIEQTLYWASVSGVDEGRYLCAILNSGTLANAVEPLQSRGQHNPRDFAMSLFAIPFPTFDPDANSHRSLTSLAASAEQVAAAVALDPALRFEAARRVMRDALHEAGVAQEIDACVATVLSEAIAAPAFEEALPTDLKGVVPDLMAVISAAAEEARVQSSAGRHRKPVGRAPRTTAQR